MEIVKIGKNRKAWLRIVEATLGIILILGAVLIFYQKNNISNAENFGENLPSLADEIAKNNTLRNEIISLNTSNLVERSVVESNIRDFLMSRITNPELNCTVRVCPAGESCSFVQNDANFKGSVYTYERILSAEINESTFNPAITPKKIKLYVWEIV